LIGTTMILSHRYKFIFIKTNKTAGTSLEIALSKYCGERDVITPISPEDERIRRELGCRGPQNCPIPFSQYTLRDWGRRVFLGKKLQFYNHMGAREIKRFVSEGVWDEYFKFCFERNPWDRVVSRYYWVLQNEPNLSISDFIKHGGADMNKKRGFQLYTVGGKIVVDKVALYENLDQELEEIAIRLGLPEKPVLPQAKSGYRKDRRHYSDLLSDEDKAVVSRLFAEEIAYLGYEY